ncbi:protein of unknown function [Taphrina deformans PYCC 5710]|uniref:Mtf2-like C-terminal domain-containing protein n=1 Tax=Taphrina deformans (strain PYCC 5710 / ATCC 11124 / CBS 356.35 / IMI 108563 / JCM 9778 / NBRC 8474) TaxID=1097556 RepID=R4XG05_TAPDE|nr:protein of unknown function [Taphrina deformans PYCC 5710]|eukprot:CCG84816.1 protein of unknown function [Taphrina deformans PYCC 5710]
MTPREKELFSKIFESILVKEQTSMQEDVSRNAISFERSKTTGQASQESRNAERPQATLARDYIGQYSSSLQGNILQAAAVVRNKTARMENNRARTAANYLAAKEELYGLRELDQVYHFLQETLFGPFRSGEVELKNPTPQLLEFCRAYPLLMADVLCILRLSFKDYSACVSVFMQMKELGIESRAIGGSPEVYNEMLLAAFEGWHDLGMVEQLLIEMKQDAIPFDLQTTVILKHIRTTIVSEREGGLAGLAFWSRNIHEVGEITNAQTTV